MMASARWDARCAMTADSISEVDATAHDERIRWLEGVAASRVSVGVSPLPAKSGSIIAEIGDRTDDDDNVIVRDSLKGLW